MDDDLQLQVRDEILNELRIVCDNAVVSALATFGGQARRLGAKKLATRYAGIAYALYDALNDDGLADTTAEMQACSEQLARDGILEETIEEAQAIKAALCPIEDTGTVAVTRATPVTRRGAKRDDD